MIELLETLRDEGFAAAAQAETSVPRECQFPAAEDIIKVAIGMRRSGKSYFLYQTINRLLSEGVEPSQILMVNFEDDRLLPMTSKEMGALLDSFYTLFPENHHRRCYLFLDEVQNVTDWHRVVRRFFDTKDVQLYLTGSSAKLLGKEIATSLRGRSLAVEVWPYSFSEYCFAHQFTRPEPPLSQKAHDTVRAHFIEYFEKGGFPAVQGMAKNEWRDTLQSYVDTVILRDIIERHKVSNIRLLKYLTTTLLKNAATVFSINKFYNDIRSQGHKVSKDTIYTYMTYLEDAFLVFSISVYTESERVKQSAPKKIYAIDNGLIHANALGSNQMLGKCFENQVYLDLRRAGKKVYFYRTEGGYEIDFVTVDKDGQRELLQVAWDMSDPATAEREQRALKVAEAELNITGRIVTPGDYFGKANAVCTPGQERRDA